MKQSIAAFNQNDLERIENLRESLAADETASGKLRWIRTIADNRWIAKDETRKPNPLGGAFGDRLEQEVPGLFWAVVDGDFGRDPALQRHETSSLTFPLTASSKRVKRACR